jgi:Icc-related predicted phosphoesterase
MRWLMAADIHYSLPQLDWLVEAAPRYDLVILAGDLLDLSSLVDIDAQIVVAQAYLRRLAGVTRVIVSSGNHDLDSRGPEGEKVAAWVAETAAEGISVDAGSLTLGDTLFTICPWWDGPATRGQVERQLAADHALRPRRWVWVYHAPPQDSPTSWTGKRSMGDADLVAWIDRYRPDIVLSGHVHQSPFVRDGSWVDRIGGTWVFNAGHQYGAPPAHIAFDGAHEEAVWISAMGVQAVKLGEPLVRPVPPLSAMPAWFTDPGGSAPSPAPGAAAAGR